MPKMTLIEMAQSILNDMDSDEVNSVDDTVESAQVASILKDTYFEIINYRLWPETTDIINLSALGDTNRPTHIKMDENVQRVDWIKYDSRDDTADALYYKDIKYLEPKDFHDIISGRDSTDSTVDTVNGFSDGVFLIYNDRAPVYWTSFDDEYLVFDSYDSGVDATLQESKLQAYGYTEPDFTITDLFVPDLPSKAFPYYLAYAKSKCFLALRGQINEKEELIARNQRSWLSRQKHKVGGGLHQPHYGRR